MTSHWWQGNKARSGLTRGERRRRRFLRVLRLSLPAGIAALASTRTISNSRLTIGPTGLPVGPSIGASVLKTHKNKRRSVAFHPVLAQKNAKDRESLEIFAPPPYRRGPITRAGFAEFDQRSVGG